MAQAAAKSLNSIYVFSQRSVAQTQTVQRPKMHRVQFEDSLAVMERLFIISLGIVKYGASVPSFSKIRRFRNQFRQQIQSVANIACIQRNLRSPENLHPILTLLVKPSAPEFSSCPIADAFVGLFQVFEQRLNR